MKKLFSTTAIVTLLGIAPLFTGVSAFAQVSAVTSPSVQHYNQATVKWPLVTGATCYNLYYGNSSKTQPMWKHSVRCLPNTAWTYTINYLKQNVSYSYTVSAVNAAGKEISWTPVASLVVSPMSK